MTCATCGVETPADQLKCPACGADTTEILRTALTTGDFPTGDFPTGGFPTGDLPTGDFTADETYLPREKPRQSTFHPIAVGESFGPRYLVVKLLGIGGMGAVYQAWDRELGIAVALKVIRADPSGGSTAGDAESESRFKRELVLARQVTHKNVIRIHDLGEVNGTKYLTMAFVEGEDLAHRLDRDRKLSVEETLKFGRQIAAGLAAAHEAGVVHRDLKPPNILIKGDLALITDFGIARSADPEADGAGGIFGTLQYMAPEQAMGRHVDHRADIYACGLIIFEMLAGRQFISEATGRRRLMSDEPIAAPAVNVEGLPEAIGEIITRCLQPDPNDRFQKTTELLAALEALDDSGIPRPPSTRVELPKWWPVIGGKSIPRVVAAAALSLLVGIPTVALSLYFGRGPAPPPPQPPPLSVLVADFQNNTDGTVEAGVVEPALGVALEQASFVNLYPREEARRLLAQVSPGASLDLQQARLLAQREGIKLVLAGSVSKTASGYEVTVNSIDPVLGKILATAQATARDKDRVLQAVNTAGTYVRATLGDRSAATGDLTAQETFTSNSLEAASTYWRAQDLLNNGKYADAAPLFQRATELDPSFARAYASWAVASYYLGRRDDTERLYKQAFSLVGRMTEREKYRTYGSYYLTVARSYDGAIQNYTKLIDLYPADRVAHGNLAMAYFYVLNFRKAVEEGRKALDLYPSSPKLRGNLALYGMYAGDFQTAVRQAEQLIKTNPSYYLVYLPLAMASIEEAPEKTQSAYEAMSGADPQGRSLAAIGLSDLALYQGRYADTVPIITSAIEADAKVKTARFSLASKYLILAEAYRGLSQTQRALNAVTAALAAGKDEATLLPAARMLLSLGREADARKIATTLNNDISGYSRVYGRVVESEIALRHGAVGEAVDALRAGQKIADLWLTHFVLGTAYVQAGRYPEGLAELEACMKRRGEAMAIFLDDVPTARYLAPLPYWLARAHEGLGLTHQAIDEYSRFLALRPTPPGDPLAVDAERRLAAARRTIS